MILIVYNFHAMFHFLFFTVLLQKIWFIHFPSLSNIPICLTLFIFYFFNNSVSVYYLGSNFHLIFLLFVCFFFGYFILFYICFLASIILHVFAWLSWNQTWLILLANKEKEKKSHIWVFGGVH